MKITRFITCMTPEQVVQRHPGALVDIVAVNVQCADCFITLLIPKALHDQIVSDDYKMLCERCSEIAVAKAGSNAGILQVKVNNNTNIRRDVESIVQSVTRSVNARNN